MRIVRRVVWGLVVVVGVLATIADFYFDDHPEKFRELTEQYAWLRWLGSISNFWAWVIFVTMTLVLVITLEVIEFRRRRKSSD